MTKIVPNGLSFLPVLESRVPHAVLVIAVAAGAPGDIDSGAQRTHRLSIDRVVGAHFDV